MLIFGKSDERICAVSIFFTAQATCRMANPLSMTNCSGKKTILKQINLTKILHRSIKAVHITATSKNNKSNRPFTYKFYKIGFYKGVLFLPNLPFSLWA